jgi:hypothetical protein
VGSSSSWLNAAPRRDLFPGFSKRSVPLRLSGNHEELLLNWFRAKGELSSGAVEGLNNKIRVITSRFYGFLPSKRWKWPSITHLDDCRNRNPPTDSAEEAKHSSNDADIHLMKSGI